MSATEPDEHDEIARIFVSGWVPGFGRESRERMISQLASQLRGAHMEGEAAGREEYLKALIRVARNRSNACIYLEELEDGKAISDAIAKERL